MWKPLLAAAVLTVPTALFAQPPDAAPLPGDVLCQDDLMICRESCSMEVGTRTQAGEKTARCFDRCDQTHTHCLQRQIAKRKATPRATEAAQVKATPPEEEHFSGAPTRFSEEPKPPQAPAPAAEGSRTDEEPAPVRREVTRSTELEAAPDREATSYPARESVRTKPRASQGQPNELGY